MTTQSLGLIAGTITSLAIIPQVLRSFRTRSVRDISIWQPLLLEIGMVLWLFYGVLINDMPLIVANGFSIFCNTLLIVMKIAFKEAPSPGEQTQIP